MATNSVEFLDSKFHSLDLDCDLSDIEKSLKSCDYYFSVWLGKETLKQEDLVRMTERLYSHRKLLSLTKSGEIEKDEELEEIRKTNKNHSLGAKLQIAVAPLVEAYLNIETGNQSTVVDKLLVYKKYVAHLIGNGENVNDYLAGFDYLNNLLEFHFCIKFGKSVPSSILVSKSSLFHYEKLTDKEKAIVWAAKWEFTECFVNRDDDMIKSLQQVVLLDSFNFNWSYLLVMRLRYVRKKLHGSTSKPSKEEIDAAVCAVELTKGTGYEAYCLGAYCQTLSEILHWRWKNKEPGQRFVFGNQEFTSTEALQYIKDNANLALQSPSVTFGELIRYGEMFSSILPWEHRDYDLAKEFYNACLISGSENSKANHKIGKLFLNGYKDVENAVTHLEKAVECEPFNFPGWLDFIQTLLGSPDSYQEKIQKAFKTVWEQTVWTENQISSLNFLHGCYHFMNQETEAAVEKWLKITITPNESTAGIYFNDLQRVKKTHCWTQQAGDMLKLEDIQSLLEMKIRRARNPNDEKILQFHKDSIMSNRPTDRNGGRNPRSQGRGFQNWRERGDNSRSSQSQAYYGGHQRRQYDANYQRRNPSPDNWRS